MTEQEFLSHHRLTRNPFTDEDAQTDSVFKSHCITEAFHPAWSKVYGDPAEPATAIVLGSKGSGKTAMRLQLMQHVEQHNRQNPDRRVFVVEYDDFNRYLGPLQHSLSQRTQTQPEKVLQSVRLWDHIDAILSEAVTKLVDWTLSEGDTSPESQEAAQRIKKLDRSQRRDLLLLSACYDQSRSGTFINRWMRLRRTLRFGSFSTWRAWLFGLVGTLAIAAVAWGVASADWVTPRNATIAAIVLVVLAWVPYLIRFTRHWWTARRVSQNVRVSRRDVRSLRRALMHVPHEELAAQPLPQAARSDDRYAMLEKLQSILRSIGFAGLIVLVDRVDEPELVNGQPQRIRDLVWPMLDNKLLKHPGLGLKLLLPSDLQYYIDRESREFNERARLDKQNVIRNFNWTGEALYELVSARLAACGEGGARPTLRDLVDPAVSEPRLLSALQSLRTPRSLFRFLFRLVMEHCKRSRSDEPSYQISSDLFESTLAVYQSENDRDDFA